MLAYEELAPTLEIIAGLREQSSLCVGYCRLLVAVERDLGYVIQKNRDWLTASIEILIRLEYEVWDGFFCITSNLL